MQEPADGSHRASDAGYSAQCGGGQASRPDSAETERLEERDVRRLVSWNLWPAGRVWLILILLLNFLPFSNVI